MISRRTRRRRTVKSGAAAGYALFFPRVLAPDDDLARDAARDTERGLLNRFAAALTLWALVTAALRGLAVARLIDVLAAGFRFATLLR